MEVCGDPLLEAASSCQFSSGSEIALYESDEGELGAANGNKLSRGAMTLRNSLKVGIAA
jgi:hypothetical protein